MIFARKMNKIPVFYMVFARKVPEFYIKLSVFSRIIGGTCPLPPSPMPMVLILYKFATGRK